MTPERIISLVPSLTELVFALGKGENLAGRTRFCIHPKDRAGSVPVIGGTKNPQIGKIRAIKPDLIIANREENRKEDVLSLQEFADVIVTDIPGVDAALREIQRVGDAIGAGNRASELVERIRQAMPAPRDHSGQQPSTGDGRHISTLYLIWRGPWMAAGSGTYIHDVMRLFGLKNACGDLPRYPELSGDDIRKTAPELILLSSEPFPFLKKHISELGIISPHSRVMLVDGQWFSWYGPRMIHSFEQLAAWRENL
jgi:ABC-type Fe3+-hydroxamate transport system substrate-binding protein